MGRRNPRWNLLKALAIDSKIVNFLLIGMYRDDENR
jgi:hypothetical protein